MVIVDTTAEIAEIFRTTATYLIKFSRLRLVHAFSADPSFARMQKYESLDSKIIRLIASSRILYHDLLDYLW